MLHALLFPHEHFLSLRPGCFYHKTINQCLQNLDTLEPL